MTANRASTQKSSSCSTRSEAFGRSRRACEPGRKLPPRGGRAPALSRLWPAPRSPKSTQPAGQGRVRSASAAILGPSGNFLESELLPQKFPQQHLARPSPNRKAARVPNAPQARALPFPKRARPNRSSGPSNSRTWKPSRTSEPPRKPAQSSSIPGASVSRTAGRRRSRNGFRQPATGLQKKRNGLPSGPKPAGRVPKTAVCDDSVQPNPSKLRKRQSVPNPRRPFRPGSTPRPSPEPGSSRAAKAKRSKTANRAVHGAPFCNPQLELLTSHYSAPSFPISGGTSASKTAVRDDSVQPNPSGSRPGKAFPRPRRPFRPGYKPSPSPKPGSSRAADTSALIPEAGAPGPQFRAFKFPETEFPPRASGRPIPAAKTPRKGPQILNETFRPFAGRAPFCNPQLELQTSNYSAPSGKASQTAFLAMQKKFLPPGREEPNTSLRPPQGIKPALSCAP